MITIKKKKKNSAISVSILEGEARKYKFSVCEGCLALFPLQGAQTADTASLGTRSPWASSWVSLQNAGCTTYLSLSS